MKVIILDDIPSMNKKITKIINQVLIEKNLDIKIISFLEYNKDLKELIYNGEIKIYILDVDLWINITKSRFDI